MTENFYVNCSKMTWETEAGYGGIRAPPRSGLVQRKMGTLKRAVKGTFEVHIPAFIKQRLVLNKRKNMAPPNVSDKDTRQNLVALYQIRARQQQKLMGRPAESAQRNR